MAKKGWIFTHGKALASLASMGWEAMGNEPWVGSQYAQGLGG